MSVEFLDVGHGDAALIRSRDVAVLIDGGKPDAGLTEKLRSRGVNHFDLVVNTHPDPDHTGGLLDVLKTMKVDKVVYNGDRHYSALLEDFLNAIEGSPTTAYVEVTRGDVLRVGPVRFEVLNPPSELLDTRDNNSIVLRMVYGSTTFLFTGDIEAKAEADILSSRSTLQSDVLKVAGHGSRRSSTSNFLRAVQPRYAVFSVAAGNRAGYPHVEPVTALRDIGAVLYGTYVNGDVRFITDGETIEVSVDRPGAVEPGKERAIEERLRELRERTPVPSSGVP